MKKSDKRIEEMTDKVLMKDYGTCLSHMGSVHVMANVQKWISKGYTTKEISDSLNEYLEEFSDELKLLYLDFYSECPK